MINIHVKAKGWATNVARFLSFGLAFALTLNCLPAAAQEKLHEDASELTPMSPAAAARPSPSPSPAQNSAPTAGQSTAAVRFKVEKFKLPNGLTVLLHEDHAAPIISYQTWFRVGSKDEQLGTTGIAHLFEHMMFTGAKRYSGEQFDNILQANGAQNNAFTTHDYTGYYENLPSSKLELVMDIESDRMENLKINPETLKSEREVVKEERRFRVDNNPSGILRELLYGTAFKVSPYRWPVIGYMTDLNNISVEKANEFYRTNYAPNNATVVIAGDFDSNEVKRLLPKYYGAIKQQPLPNQTRPVEPAQTAPRTFSVEKEVQAAQFAIAYHTPKAGSDEGYALDLLANVLGFGNSSRMYQRLVYRDQTAQSVGVVNFTAQDSGFFQIFVTLKPGANVERARRSIYGEMWRPSHLVIRADELQKAKNQVMKGYVDGLKTVHGKAEALALNETMFGDYERLFTDLDHYNKVTALDIKKAAAKYLNPNQATFVLLKPKKAGARK